MLFFIQAYVDFLIQPSFLYTLYLFCFTEKVLPMAYTHSRDHGKQLGIYEHKLEYSKNASVHQMAAYLSGAAANPLKNLLPEESLTCLYSGSSSSMQKSHCTQVRKRETVEITFGFVGFVMCVWGGINIFM